MFSIDILPVFLFLNNALPASQRPLPPLTAGLRIHLSSDGRLKRTMRVAFAIGGFFKDYTRQRPDNGLQRVYFLMLDRESPSLRHRVKLFIIDNLDVDNMPGFRASFA